MVGGINSKEGGGCHNTWAQGREAEGIAAAAGVWGLVLPPLPACRAQSKALMQGAQVYLACATQSRALPSHFDVKVAQDREVPSSLVLPPLAVDGYKADDLLQLLVQLR